MQSSAQNRFQDYMSANNTTFTYLNSTIPEAQSSSGFNMGESSSSVVLNLNNHNEQKVEPVWASSTSVASGVHTIFQERHHELLSGGYSVNVNLSGDQIAHGPTFVESSVVFGSAPRDLNINIESGEQGSDDCQIVECPPIFKSISLENAGLASGNSFSNPIELNVGGYAESSDGRPRNSLDCHHLSRKRKAIEGNIGQSSGSRSSNYFQHTEEGSAWHVVPPRQNAVDNLNISSPSENAIGVSQMEHSNPRFGMGIGGVVSESPPPSSAIGVSESSYRNLRLRFNSSHQLDSLSNYMFAVGPSNYLSSPLDVLSAASTVGGVPQGQSLVPTTHRNRQSSRRNRTSISRNSSSSNSANALDNRDVASFEETRLRSMQRNILDHPMFIPASGMRNSAQSETSWNLTGDNSITRNVGSSRNGPTSGAHPSSAPNVVRNRNSPQYSRSRLSELAHRSLVSPSLPESRGQITNPLASTQGMPISSGNQGDHFSHSRSATLLDRHLDGSFGFPHSRSLGASEGRRRFVSEIRNVLDQMRRGEGLRFEDVMMLEQSGFFGMVGSVHDRHRDLRLDVDNMSYEELLALEDRIGYVNTGLSKEAILKCVKRRKYRVVEIDHKESEPCCICQEEYIVGDNLGKLDCGHDFHTECIKEWLTHKNMCPICKTTTMDTKEKS